MQYTRKVLPNGLRLITVPMVDNPTVTVLVLVEAGSKYESKEENGISHFLEHMCFKGTHRRPNSSTISTELDSLGAHYNAFTSQEYTGYYAKVQFGQLASALDIVSDMYLNPLFKPTEIEKEKGVIIEEINMYEDLPQAKVAHIFAELLFTDQPAGRPILGPISNIQKMTQADFIKYRARCYKPASTTVIISGNIVEAEVQAEVSKIFSGLVGEGKGEKPAVKINQTVPQTALFQKDTDQSHLIFGVRSFCLTDKRSPVLRVLRGVLGGGMSSRLFKILRDELGVCYYVSASADQSTDHGEFYVKAGVDSKRVDEVVQVLITECNKLKTDLVPEAELLKTKQHLIGSLFLGLESSDDLAEFYGGQEIVNEQIKTPLEVKAEIESVTALQIQQVAKDIFVDAGLNLAVVGRFQDQKHFLNLLKF